MYAYINIRLFSHDCFSVPLRPSGAFDCWIRDGKPFPKRRQLLASFMGQNERVLVDKVVVYEGDRSEQLGLGHIRVNNHFKVAMFHDCFDLSDAEHFTMFRSLLLKIDLDRVRSIDFELSEYFQRVPRGVGSIQSAMPHVWSGGEVHYISKFSIHDIDKAARHLNGKPNKEISKELEEQVDGYIRRGFRMGWCVNDESHSYDFLVRVHEKSKEWIRGWMKQENEMLDSIFFEEVLEECVEYLQGELAFLKGDIELEVFSPVWTVAAHALCESQKTKTAQRTKNADKKREKSYSLWKRKYHEKPQKDRPSIRQLSGRIGVSKSTLHRWFQEFDQGIRY